MKALIFETFGGPDVLQYKEIPDPIDQRQRNISKNESSWIELC